MNPLRPLTEQTALVTAAGDRATFIPVDFAAGGSAFADLAAAATADARYIR